METSTKIAESLFCRRQGATMDEVIAATGGYHYNVLRRLELRGYRVRREREGRATRYWAVPPSRTSYTLCIGVNGQTTLPKAIRERLGIKSGGELEATLEDGKVVMAPKTVGIGDVAGILGRPGTRAKTVAEMDEGIAKVMKVRHSRGRA
jgi:antitoxin PrlF